VGPQFKHKCMQLTHYKVIKKLHTNCQSRLIKLASIQPMIYDNMNIMKTALAVLQKYTDCPLHYTVP